MEIGRSEKLKDEKSHRFHQTFSQKVKDTDWNQAAGKALARSHWSHPSRKERESELTSQENMRETVIVQHLSSKHRPEHRSVEISSTRRKESKHKRFQLPTDYSFWYDLHELKDFLDHRRSVS